MLPSLKPSHLALSVLTILSTQKFLPSLPPHPFTSAGVTVYSAANPAATTAPAEQSASTSYDGLPAYDPLTLTAPAPPEGVATAFTLSVPPTEEAMVEVGGQIGVKQRGNFLGFSVELSVAQSILGNGPTNLKIPFLNYLANIRARAGQGAIVRVGGNSQEGSTLFFDGQLGDGTNMIEKIKLEGASVTSTPLINYTPNLFYAMSNISSIVDTVWYFGLPFNQSAAEGDDSNIPYIAEYAQSILGEKLLGLQLGNEPDLYSGHSKRNYDYTPAEYLTEFNTVKQEILDGAQLAQKQFLVGPSICCEVAGFELGDVLSAGWLTDNLDNLAIVAVQYYPENNCQINGRIVDPQDIFPMYLDHTLVQTITQPYIEGTYEVLAAGKEIMMFETNTASCGGFPGLSDSFGAAMWVTDYALQMAYRNFTAALLHVGGQNVYYNPFTPPPTNLSRIGYQWTTGSVYYSTLIIAEAFGSSNQSQVVDMYANSGDTVHPAYGIYENGVPTRMVLFNYVSDESGHSDLSVTIDMNGTALPRGTVDVRYFWASSVAEKYEIYWANQTLGKSFASDGRLYGNQETVSINCDTTANNCIIPLKAPSIALVFLTDTSLQDSSAPAGATTTFATSVVEIGGATVDSGQLSTGNGQAGGGQETIGANSKGSVGGAQGLKAPVAAVGVVGMAMVLGAAWLGMR